MITAWAGSEHKASSMALELRLLQGVTTFAHSCGVLVPRHHSQVDFCLEMPRKTTRHKCYVH